MDIVNRRPGLVALLAFVVGLLLGLVVLGWWLFPVEWSGTDPSGLFPEYQSTYVRNAAELYSFDNNQDKLRSALGSWGGDSVACELAASAVDAGDQARLVAAAAIVNGQGCTGLAAPGAQPGGEQAATAVAPGAEGAADTQSNLLPLLLLGLLLLLLLVAVFYVWSRRRTLGEGTESGTMPEYTRTTTGQKAARPTTRTAGTAQAAAATAPVLAEPTTVPIARFRTSYTRGHDTYDDSFSIENAAGDFLGECGVGISEAIGATTPKNVTAFEVWLFDKNDIRTITKVIMSDHAFFDEALKAKLAPKGEPVLARENETIVLETASLIINAEITEMDYGSVSDLPDASYFDRFTIELSAWAKEGDYAASPSSDAGEDLLNFSS
jgi:hypothetical protein